MKKLNWKNENEAIGHNGTSYHLEEIKIPGEKGSRYNITKTCKADKHNYRSDLCGGNGDEERLDFSRAAALKECEKDYARSMDPGQIEWFYGSGRKTRPGKFNPVSELMFYGYKHKDGVEYRVYTDRDDPEIFTSECFQKEETYYLVKLYKNEEYSLHPGPGYYTTCEKCQKLAHQDYIKEKDTKDNTINREKL